jgi:YihY family inner membrane protein
VKAPQAITRLASAYLREREEVRRLVEVLRHSLRGLIRSQIPRMAAALAYRTLFSLVPVLVVGAVVMSAFLSDSELRTQLDRLISYIGLDTIVIEEEGAAGPFPATPSLMPAGPDPDGGVARLDSWIASLVERVSSLPFRAIGFIGVLVLLYGAISMLVELERAFNQICGATSGRAWAKRVTTYWTTLTLGVVFLLATFSVGDAAGNWVASLGRGDGETGGWLSRGLVQFFVSITINTILLLFAYSTVPNARVRFRPALGGAVIAGLGWELGKIALTQYVRYAVGGLEQLYGVLAILPLFMFWVYITWIIVLFGLHVAYSLQTFNTRLEKSDLPQTGLIDPGLVVAIASLAVDRFRDGRAVRVSDIEHAHGVPVAMSGLLLEGLAKSGVMHEVEMPDGERGFALARPAERITIRELLEIGRTLRQGGVRGGSPETDTALDRALDGVVLADLQRGAERPDIPGISRPAPAARPGPSTA